MEQIQDLVFVGEHEKLLTTSLKVAEVFGKDHARILKDIRSLKCSENFTEGNFALSEYEDVTGRRLPMYVITRDGFTILVMSYTGKKAMQFKESYIEAFNKMEAELKRQQEEARSKLSPLDILAQTAAALAEQDRRVRETKQIASTALCSADKANARIDAWEQERKDNGELLFKEKLSENTPPADTLRTQVVRVMSQYCRTTNTDYKDAWAYLYKELRIKYHIDLKRRCKGKDKPLAVAERIGCLSQLYDLASDMVRRKVRVVPEQEDMEQCQVAKE